MQTHIRLLYGVPGMVSGGSDVMSGGSEVVSGGRSVVSRFSGSLNGSVDLAKI